MRDDAALLLDYARTRSADAFAQQVQRYAGLVYGARLRVTGDPHDAEDVAQECFMELARHAGSVTSPLPAWLHVTAVNRSRNALRSGSRRKRHEKQAMSAKDSNSEPRWADVAPCVDQAIAELPEGLRVQVLLHYLNGLTQSQVVTEPGIDQSTVCRRIEKGIEELRAKLWKAGVVASVAVLGVLLAENAASAAPASFTAGLAKMVMAGVGSSAASGATAAALASVWAKVAVAVAAGLAIAGAAVVYERTNRGDPHVRVVTAKQTRPLMIADYGHSVPPKEDAMPKAAAEHANIRRDGNLVWIEGVPHGEGNSNSYARGLAIVLNHAGTPADDRTVVREALRFAIEHGAGKHSNEKWHTGLPGYDTWIAALRDEKLANEPGRGFGHAYNAQCWAECRHHAVAFFEEAENRIADLKFGPLFGEALKDYRVVAEQLGTIARLFPFDLGTDKAMDARLRDAALRAAAVDALQAARGAESAGLHALSDLSAAVGAK